MTKTAHALKHAPPKAKLRYMSDYMELRDTINDNQQRISENGYPIGTCGHELKNRPLWMVGKYNICFACYETNEADVYIGNIGSTAVYADMSALRKSNQKIIVRRIASLRTQGVNGNKQADQLETKIKMAR